MLKNVSISKAKLEEVGFAQENTDRYHTVMKKGKYTATVNPNGSITINGITTDFKCVKRGKIKGLD